VGGGDEYLLIFRVNFDSGSNRVASRGDHLVRHGFSATAADPGEEQRKTGKEQPASSLFFGSPDHRRAGISAKNESPLGDNSWRNSKNSERHA
jgi:hypothetical protein